MKMLHKILACSTVATALALTSAQAQNLLTDPGFELGDFVTGLGAGGALTAAQAGLGWDNNFGGSGQGQNDMSSSADFPHSGSYAMLAVNAPANAWNPQGSYQIIANSSVGATWSASVWALTDTGLQGASTAGTGPVDFQVQFLDGSLANISTADYGWSAIAANDTWQQYSFSGIVPAGTQYISVYDFAMIGTGPVMPGNLALGPVNVYFDDNSLTVTPEPTTLALAGMGGVSLLSLIRRRKS